MEYMRYPKSIVPHFSNKHLCNMYSALCSMYSAVFLSEQRENEDEEESMGHIQCNPCILGIYASAFDLRVHWVILKRYSVR